MSDKYIMYDPAEFDKIEIKPVENSDNLLAEIDRLREESKIFREGFDGLTRGNQELQRQILSQYAVIDEMITTKGKLLKALQSIAIIEDEKKARAIAFEVLDDLYGVD